jgi:hypothetical protein
VLQLAQATELFANGPNPGVQMQPIKEGKICWDPISAFGIIVPPGIPNERNFPWECIVRPTLLADVQDLYPAAADMREDGDIGTGLGIATSARARPATQHRRRAQTGCATTSGCSPTTNAQQGSNPKAGSSRSQATR